MRLAAATAVGVLMLAGCSGPAATDQVGFQSGDGTVTIIPVADRRPAPVLTGTTLDGEQVSTADFAGRPVVINVWGSWCAPCRAEAPELVEAHQRLDGEVAFLGVNTRDLDVAPAQAFQRAFGISYPSIYDPDGELLLGFAQLPPKAIPSTVIIDADGDVAARVLGAVDASTLDGILADIRTGP